MGTRVDTFIALMVVALSNRATSLFSRQCPSTKAKGAIHNVPKLCKLLICNTHAIPNAISLLVDRSILDSRSLSLRNANTPCFTALVGRSLLDSRSLSLCRYRCYTHAIIDAIPNAIPMAKCQLVTTLVVAALSTSDFSLHS